MQPGPKPKPTPMPCADCAEPDGETLGTRGGSMSWFSDTAIAGVICPKQTQGNANQKGTRLWDSDAVFSFGYSAFRFRSSSCWRCSGITEIEGSIIKRRLRRPGRDGATGVFHRA